jgi:hypothetical protein
MAAILILLVYKKHSSFCFLGVTDLVFHAVIMRLGVTGRGETSNDRVYYSNEFGYRVRGFL